MCGGVEYTDLEDKTWKVFFPSPKAALPVLKRDGAVEWVTWGKRKEEQDDYFAPGGWARLDSINDGKWKRFHPKPVVIPVQAFMEKDGEKKSHWIQLPDGQAIQGLLAMRGNEARVYVVTTETPADFAWVHDRWPRLIQKSSVDAKPNTATDNTL